MTQLKSSVLYLFVVATHHFHPSYGAQTGYSHGKQTEPHLMNMRGFTEGDTGITDWFATGQAELNRQINDVFNFGEAKNLIFFLGDGMGISTTTATRVYKAQTRNLKGEDVKLAFEKFPHAGYSMTYVTDHLSPDSAGTATAFMCGEKAKRRHVGVSQHVPVGNCTAQTLPGMKLKSILKHAIDAGKSTGIVSTVRVTHATPATSYAHAAHRDWESDGEQAAHDEYPLNEEERELCPDIARQLLEDEYAKNIKVILGGGRQMFLPNTTQDPEYDDEYGTRLDSRDLIQEWIQQKIDGGIDSSQVKYVRNLDEFDAVNPDNTEFLLGLFEPSDMHYDMDRQNTSINKWPEPSLTEMVEKAIKMLEGNDNGYLLLVEGGKIDKGHHQNWAVKALDETLAMSDAVEKASDSTNTAETLIVVTADHSHTMAINGYPHIDSHITGISTFGDDSNGNDIIDDSMEDGKPHTILSYTNGPGYAYHRGLPPGDGVRKDISEDYRNGLIGQGEYRYDSAMYKDSGTHSGEDVPLFAKGPMSHLFIGVHEQHYIAHAMMYASCVGPNQAHCQGAHYPMECTTSGASVKTLTFSSPLIFFFLFNFVTLLH